MEDKRELIEKMRTDHEKQIQYLQHQIDSLKGAKSPDAQKQGK